MTTLPFKVRAATRNIHLVDLDCTSKTNEWWFLLSGDRHHDNPHADHELELKHLEEAKARRAGIIDVAICIARWKASSILAATRRAFARSMQWLRTISIP